MIASSRHLIAAISEAWREIKAESYAIFPVALIDAAYEQITAPRPKPTYPFWTRRVCLPPPNHFAVGDFVSMGSTKGQIIGASLSNPCYWLVLETSGQRAWMRYDTLVLLHRPLAIVAVGAVIDHPAPEPPMIAANIIQFPRCSRCGQVKYQIVDEDGVIICYDCKYPKLMRKVRKMRKQTECVQMRLPL